LLIVLGEYSNFPSFNNVHPPEYYNLLGFGDPAPPFTTDGPVNPASLREYFRENSNGRFWFDPVDVVGPIDLGEFTTDPGPQARSAGILKRVAEARPELFANHDADQDRTVAFNELCVVLIENITGALPANRDNDPFRFSFDFPHGPAEVTVRIHVAGAGPLTPFFQIAHELAHSIGTKDMYNTGQGHYGLTVMSGYPFFSNDQGSVHLDIWHKLILGWAEPRPFPLSPGNSVLVRTDADGAVLLWDDTHRAEEFFLIERRHANSAQRHYDSLFPGDGVLIWRVRQGLDASVAHLGAPDLAWGGSGVWRPGQQTPELKWSNGQPTGMSVTVTDAGGGAMRVGWDRVAPGRHLRLLYGGNGTTSVDSGLPSVGVFYGITRNGDLEWNRYTGNGEPFDPVSSTNLWDGNTGNLIGRGFGHIKHLLGCGDGIVLAVHPNGNLHWFSYAGHGESDVTGTLGWRPNSGNVIGNGWQNFRHVFVAPQSGRSSSTGPEFFKLFAVAQNGDLLWYAYNGNGEHDPSGTLGWHPNSGNQIGRGWQNLTHIHGSGSTVFGVHQNGNLLWYSYSGWGEQDPTGARGWHENSGHAIGRGFHNSRHIFGGVSDVGGFGHIVYAVDQTGVLRWYRYTGQGEKDVTGVLGWDPRSGSPIGINW
jgi:hypothetical protein